MNRPHLISIATCFLIVFALVPAVAQTDISALQDEIIRNEEMLQSAKELVSTTNSVKARLSLEQAILLHQQSKAAFASAAGNESLVRAATLTKRARQVIFQTIALAKREAKLEENAAKAIERASTRVDQARQLLVGTDQGNAPARRLLEEAFVQLNRSKDNMREHRYEVALNLAVSAERLANRSVQTMKRDSAAPDVVENELEKTNHVIERLADRIGPDASDRIRRLYDEARDGQRRAHEQFRSQNYRAALDLTEQARNLAMRALRMAASQADRENVEQAMRLTDALIDEARALATERRDERFARRIEQAEAIQRNAMTNYERGDLAGALRLTRRARNVLKDALGDARDELGAASVNAALVATDEALSRLQEALSESEDAVAAELYASALAKQQRAWEAFTDEELRVALANTRLARNLVRRAMRRLTNAEL